MAVTAITHDFAERLSCDICGSERAELRRQPLLGFVPDMDVCSVCFRELNAKDDFNQMPLIQEAKHHA